MLVTFKSKNYIKDQGDSCNSNSILLAVSGSLMMNTSMYLKECCWYLLLVVLIVSSHDISGCTCGQGKHINIDVVNHYGSGLSSIRNKLGTASRYTVQMY